MERPRGRIITFYSYKGGTGRSMALANFAWIAAASGKRVLAMDWDLEAPGLHRYFRPFLVDPDLFETDGLIDTFWSLAASALTKATSGEKRSAPEDRAEAADALEDATRRLDWEFPTGGYIDFIGAGRQDGTYSERVNSFDWKRFFEVGGARILTAAKAHLRTRYDWVLIDSRTGVSDTSGICTIQMPEAVIACFTLNRQSIDGIISILRSIRAFRSVSVDGSAIDFYPIATRIENAEQARLEVARGYARSALADFLPKAMQSRQREYWDRMEISYRPAYAFEEVLAAFGDATGPTGAADTMLSQVETMAQAITGDKTLRMPEILEADRARVLDQYAFGTAATVPAKRSDTAGAATDAQVLRNVRAKEQLWRATGFRWRLLLSRAELDHLTDDDRREFGRDMTFYLVQSERMQKLSRTVGRWSPLSLTISLALVCLVYLVGMKGSLSHAGDQWRVLSTGVLGTWVLLALAGTGIAARDRPHGLRFLEVLILLLAGPYQPDISDYVPDQKALPSGPIRARRAAALSDAVAEVMKGIDFDKALQALPPYCFALMQSVSPEDQQVLIRAVDALQKSEAEPSVKALLLGIELINVVGLDVLRAAVESLGDQIRSVSEAPEPTNPLTSIQIPRRQEPQAFIEVHTIVAPQPPGGMESNRYQESLKSVRDASFVAIKGGPMPRWVQPTEVDRIAEGVEEAPRFTRLVFQTGAGSSGPVSGGLVGTRELISHCEGDPVVTAETGGRRLHAAARCPSDVGHRFPRGPAGVAAMSRGPATECFVGRPADTELSPGSLAAKGGPDRVSELSR